MTPKFDPFNDRLARDIRNGLSSALVESFADLDQVNRVSSAFLADQRLLPHHIVYIHERLRRYQAVLTTVKKYQLDGIVCPALAMWDQQLFFEVHECLEAEWYPAAAGDRKKALQALICAAGTYVHVEQGNTRGASKMAARAITGLTEFSHALPELGTALSTLTQSLKSPVKPPLIFSQTACCQTT